MTVRQSVQAVLDRYTFSGMAKVYDARLAISPDQSLSRSKPVLCSVTFTMPNTDKTGAPFVCETAFRVYLDNPTKTHTELMVALTDRMLHEMAESVWFDGVQPLDPHTQSSAWRSVRVGLGV